MQKNGLAFLTKALFALEISYWAWLVGCFLTWFRLAIGVAKLDDQTFFKSLDFLIFNFIFHTDLGGFLMYPSFSMPLIFMIVSIIRRKISAWELGVITLTWIMMFYVFPHLRS